LSQRIVITSSQEEGAELVEIFKRKEIQVDVKTEEGDKFLPSPWMELAIAATPAVIKVLYDFVKNRKKKSKILVQTEDATLELTANGLEELKLILDKKKIK
jgi:hypothetical protein